MAEETETFAFQAEINQLLSLIINVSAPISYRRAFSGTDADGDSLTYTWIFDDPNITIVSGQGTSALTLQPTQVGSFTGRVIVSDGTDTFEQNVVVQATNNQPTVSTQADATVVHNETVVTLTGTMTDIDGDAIAANY